VTHFSWENKKKTPTEKVCKIRRSMALTLMERILKKNMFKRIITPITLI
jgi:hypothetical protein